MTQIPDREAYGLFDAYYSGVRAFIRSIVKERWVAEDLTQETFIRAYRNLPSLKEKKRVKPWLYRIAKNLCMDFLRRGQKEITPDHSMDETVFMDRSADQELALEKLEMTECVRNHFQLLPENFRTVLWLFDAEGFTHKEIAQILDIDVPNVKVRLHRARKKMKEILNDRCHFERDGRNVFVCVPSTKEAFSKS